MISRAERRARTQVRIDKYADEVFKVMGKAFDKASKTRGEDETAEAFTERVCEIADRAGRAPLMRIYHSLPPQERHLIKRIKIAIAIKAKETYPGKIRRLLNE